MCILFSSGYIVLCIIFVLPCPGKTWLILCSCMYVVYPWAYRPMYIENKLCIKFDKQNPISQLPDTSNLSKHHIHPEKESELGNCSWVSNPHFSVTGTDSAWVHNS